MFEIGQLVTCKELGRYAVTDRGKPLRVVSVGDEKVRVATLWDLSEHFKLSKNALHPMDENEILKKGQLVKVVANGEAVIAKFESYLDYGIRVILENGMSYSLVMMHLINSNVRGSLYV